MKTMVMAGLLAAGLCWPAAGQDLTAMTEEERAAFQAEVRAYLLANPEILIEMSQALEERQAAAQAETDKTLVAAHAEDILNDADSYVGGNPDGSLTVVEFIDYRCGYCRKAHDDVMALVAGDSDIRYVVKEFPILGEESVVASRFAISALRALGPEAYASINAGFYETFRGEVNEATLTAFAGELGLDPGPILAGMNDPEVDRIIGENHMLAERLSIGGTPTFVIGGEMVRGFMPLEGLQAMVAAARG